MTTLQIVLLLIFLLSFAGGVLLASAVWCWALFGRRRKPPIYDFIESYYPNEYRNQRTGELILTAAQNAQRARLAYDLAKQQRSMEWEAQKAQSKADEE